MTHRSCCDVLLPDGSGSRVTTVYSTDPSSMCFSCFLFQLFCLGNHSSSAFKNASLLGLCSLVHLTLSVPDCEAVWTRDEFLADCSLSCRRKICAQSVMYCTDLRHVLICIGDLMPQRITVSGNCCWHLCHDGKLRS